MHRAIFIPVVSLDVIAHELGHGYAQSMVNFDINNYQAQTLNEGLSDIWAACVEQYSITGKQTWKMGEDIIKSGYSCVRNLASTNSGIDSRLTYTGGYPDVYFGSYWDTRSTPDPHINSTVLGHWFYLLAAGGDGVNSSGTAYNLSNIGIDHASRIVYNAERTGRLTPPSDYAVARTAMINAATALYGSCSADVIATTNAWYAVGIGSPFATLNGAYNNSAHNSVMYTTNRVSAGKTVVTLNVPTATWVKTSGNPDS